MVSTDFRLGEFVVQPQADRLSAEDGTRRVELEPKTMAVLTVLAERSGQVVSSAELVHLVWHDRPLGDNPVYKVIGKLRRAFGDEAGRPRYIETIPRKGYRLLVAPAPVAGPQPAPSFVDQSTRVRGPGRAGWSVPRPLARLAATFLLLGVAIFLAGTSGPHAHATVGCMAPPGSSAVRDNPR